MKTTRVMHKERRASGTRQGSIATDESDHKKRKKSTPRAIFNTERNQFDQNDIQVVFAVSKVIVSIVIIIKKASTVFVLSNTAASALHTERSRECPVQKIAYSSSKRQIRTGEQNSHLPVADLRAFSDFQRHSMH
jgi:hypothetical protein